MLPKPPTPKSDRSELIIGLVGATGTDLGIVADGLSDAIARVGYHVECIRLIELLEVLPKWSDLPDEPTETRIERRMDAGDEFCGLMGNGNALARLAVGKIRDIREKLSEEKNRPLYNCAYILRSLKRKEEADFLRTLYGDRFLLIGAFAARSARVESLAARIAKSHHSASTDEFRSHAEKLVQRDLNDQTKKHGQHVGDTFPLSDFFVNVTNPGALSAAIDRFIEILFRHPFHTPTKDEYGMFHAQTASLRSAALGRQVGAAITTTGGAVIAVGTNDVPKAGGGQYWEGDQPDNRDHILQVDKSDEVRRSMLAEVFERLVKSNWLDADRAQQPIDDLVNEALKRGDGILLGTQVMRVIEYGRSMHAEMAALVDSAERGVSVRGATLYATTYPCHMCARHIIGAGIGRVVYLEPYPKSLTTQLHNDAMVNDLDSPPLIGFHAFMGVAPRRYLQFFEMVDRKQHDGRIVDWTPLSCDPRGTTNSLAYLSDELTDFDALIANLKGLGLSRPDGVVVQQKQQDDRGGAI